jgi:Ca-activated chloride channel family protein
VSRVVLLTDGLANEGITDPQALAHHARELYQRGVGTSTFGVGTEYDEDLLEDMSAHGGGRYTYIDEPARIPGLFADELGRMLTTVARSATLTIILPDSGEARLAGGLPHTRSGRSISVVLGDLNAGEERFLHLLLFAPPASMAESLSIAAELAYTTCSGEQAVARTELSFRYAAPEEAASVDRDADLARRAAESQMETAVREALRQEKLGLRDQAQQTVEAMAYCLAPDLDDEQAGEYSMLRARVAEGLSESERKERHFQSYRTRQSRK